MTDFPVLQDLGTIILAAAGLLLAARAVRVPPIIAYIAAGLLLGPVTGLVHATESVDLIAEAGIALLLFLVGLELSLDKIRDVGRVALLAGLGQLALSGILGYALALLLGFDSLVAGLLALAFAFSSTVVVVKLLERKGDFSSVYGRIAIGILLVQDVAVAIALTLLAGLADTAALDLATLGRGLLRAFLGMSALVLAAFLMTRLVLPPLFGWLSRLVEGLFIWSLAWAFLFILAAEAFGLSIEIGAFVAGVALAQLSFNEELIRRVHPLVNFFLAVFFVTLGVHMELEAALAQWPAVLAFVLFVLIGKPAILMALVPRFGYGERTSFLTSLTLGQTSEFSFIVATLALGAGLVDEAFLSLVGAVGLLTIGISAALIQGSDRVYARLGNSAVLRIFRAPPPEESVHAEKLTDHVIVVGMNTLGQRIVEALAERGETVLAIDTDPRKLEGVPAATLQGDTEDHVVLEEANLAEAKLLVSALNIEDANNLLAYRCSRLGVPSSIHAFDPVLISELREYGATHLMISKHDGIRQIAAAFRETGAAD